MSVSPDALRHRDRRNAAIRIALGSCLLLFLLAAAAYLIVGQPERSGLQTVVGVILDKQWRGPKLRRHVEFDVGQHHLYYGGLDANRIGSRLEPGTHITALVHPHGYRSGVLVVEELSADGQLLMTHERRRRHYRRFGYIASVFALLALGYILFCWQSVRRCG
jgi:hypothetical protein